jgi:hypothetical protein
MRARPSSGSAISPLIPSKEKHEAERDHGDGHDDPSDGFQDGAGNYGAIDRHRKMILRRHWHLAILNRACIRFAIQLQYIK